ncbi:MAG: CHASE2 domain-containing protein [Nostocaceae cyanobacterium]|nr:CHASE2 domain-containing protein [Nostocaceae cyanobacterium]
MSFILKIWRVQQTCLFELTWDHSRTLSAKLTYPETLSTLYHQWQKAYFNFYRSAFRARPGISLSLPQPAIDWRTILVQAEAAFLAEFHYWLNSAELVAIRREIAVDATQSSRVDLFIRCDSLEMMKLPWESWQIGTEFGATNPIRIVRTSANLQASQPPPISRQQARILVILGDDTGLDFQAERTAVQKLSPQAEIEFVGWRANQTSSDLKTAICQAIADKRGWDILFFAGHSNETTITGGELAIAPHVSILVSEIAQYLQIAQERGLQFAIFNSCNGLSIAESLLNLGLNQVAVMREPIHNEVAKEFLIQFLRQLAEYQDVQAAMLAACQFLKLAQNLTYPSAYLIPSLFCHPQAEPFCLQRRGWKHHLKQWLPNKIEALALLTLASLSTLLPLQSSLIDQRQYVQSIYRHATAQGIAAQTPPVLLIQVDEDSLKNDAVEIINQNLDRNYLAKLVDRVSTLNASTVGLDYLLFRRQPRGDTVLAQALETAVTQKGTQFVFAATWQDVQSRWSDALPEIANPKWRINGDMDLLGDPAFYARVIGDTNEQQDVLPMAYQLVRLQPQAGTEERDAQFHLHPISKFAAAIGQMWFRPLIDFSIPPDLVYQTVPAWKLLQSSVPIKKQIVLISPGGQIDAGVKPGEDNFTSPMALTYWRGSNAKMTGGEVHAYLVHNLLHQRLIIPVPDLWMVGIAAFLGKGSAIWVARKKARLRQVKWFCGMPLFYGVIILQGYISLAILFPWLFPSVTYITYLLPSIWKRDKYD